MIAFASSIMQPEVYRRHAGAGIARARESDSLVFAHAGAGPIARSYNLMLDHAGAAEELEALVLLHEDAEIIAADFCSRVRRVLADESVAVLGAVGARGAGSIAWWEGAVTWGCFVHSSPEFQPGEMPRLNWNGEELAPDAGTGAVDTLDGFVLVLSSWAVRNLRFNEALSIQHGFDLDICMQARAAGRSVVAEELGVLHHHPLELVRDPETWIESHMAVSEHWDPAGKQASEQEWKLRARRAEAEAGAARLAGASKLLQAYARAEEHEQELIELERSPGWRLTRPLRELNLRRRARLT